MNQDIMVVCTTGHKTIFRAVPIACISDDFYKCYCGSTTQKIMRRRDGQPFVSNSFIPIYVHPAQGVRQ
jgi:hypothetical protein